MIQTYPALHRHDETHDLMVRAGSINPAWVRSLQRSLSGRPKRFLKNWDAR